MYELSDSVPESSLSASVFDAFFISSCMRVTISSIDRRGFETSASPRSVEVLVGVARAFNFAITFIAFSCCSRRLSISI